METDTGADKWQQRLCFQYADLKFVNDASRKKPTPTFRNSLGQPVDFILLMKQLKMES